MCVCVSLSRVCLCLLFSLSLSRECSDYPSVQDEFSALVSDVNSVRDEPSSGVDAAKLICRRYPKNADDFHGSVLISSSAIAAPESVCMCVSRNEASLVFVSALCLPGGWSRPGRALLTPVCPSERPTYSRDAVYGEVFRGVGGDGR